MVSGGYRRVAGCMVILALVAAGYWGVWRFGFTNLDDDVYVLKNPQVEGLDADHLQWALTSFEHAIWSPLVWISFMVDYEIAAHDASVYHLQNLFWHAGATLLLFLVLAEMTGALGRSALVAVVFGVHPVHVESVAWIAERKDVLSAAFFMLALAAYLVYTRRPGLLRYAALAAAMILGLASKPTVVTLPFVLLLLDHWPLGRLRSRAELWLRLREKTPLFALSLLSCLVTAAAHRDSLVPLETLDLAARFANSAISYVQYLWMFVWPVDLGAYYPHPETSAQRGAPAVVAGLAVLAATAGAVHLRHRRPYVATGWLWYVGVLVPMIGLVRFGAIARADRFLHLPSIGLAILVVWGIGDLFARWAVRRSVGTGVAIAWVLALTMSTRLQVSYWSDSATLLRRALAVAPGAYLPHYNLGCALAAEGKFEQAVSQFESALRFAPGDPDALGNLGLSLTRLGRRDDALAAFDEAARRDPDHVVVTNGRGILYAEDGELDRAAAAFERTLELDPGFSDARYNLELVRRQQRERETSER